MIELERDTMIFRFPEVHAEAVLRVTLQRTLRIPDDGKTYPLPPGLGAFPVRAIDDFKERVPAKWVEHGGVMVPLYQSEALWISFQTNYPRGRAAAYPFAVRVAAGKVNAVSGNPWLSNMVAGDYLVTPPQRWLDGFCVEKGKIRQFVAMPLGWGLSVEQQVTGKEEHGGLQLEVYPMKGAEYDKRYPVIPTTYTLTGGGILRGMSSGSYTGGNYPESMIYTSCNALQSNTMDWTEQEQHCRGLVADMGLGAGGSMQQEIYEDTLGMDVWEQAQTSRSFIHLTNSLSWEAITGYEPPTKPRTAEDYIKQGLPWFDHYLDGVPIAEGGENLKHIKSILQLGFQKGLGSFPGDGPAIAPEKVHVLGKRRPPPPVRTGAW